MEALIKCLRSFFWTQTTHSLDKCKTLSLITYGIDSKSAFRHSSRYKSHARLCDAAAPTLLVLLKLINFMY